MLRLNSGLATVCLASVIIVAPVAKAAGGEAFGTSGPVRGVVRAVHQATISTDSPLLAVELAFREGDRFRRGASLAVFDCRRQKSELDATLATQREAALTLDSNVQLDRHKAIGRNDVEIARARLDKARADVAVLERRLDDCQLVAPFDGRVVELNVRVHERTVPQRPYITLLDDSRLEIELIAPASMLADLQPGVAFSFRIDELAGRRIEAKVGTIAAAVNPVSKTVKVIGAIQDPAPEILAGMSGTALFEAVVQ